MENDNRIGNMGLFFFSAFGLSGIVDGSASPKGARPFSTGSLRRNKPATNVMQSEMRPMVNHPVRQPSAPNDVLIQGISSPVNTMAIPFPESMIPAARPRLLFKNQWETKPIIGTLAKPDPIPVAT